MTNPSVARLLKRTRELREKGELPNFKVDKVGITPKLPVPDCKHRGELTGGTVTCGSCRGRVSIKLYSCAKFGTCTLAKPTSGNGCCATCTEREPP